MQLIKLYILRVLISFDQFINTILGGYPDATISGRMGRAIEKDRCKACKFICWILGKIDKNHCIKSIERDEVYKDLWDWSK